MPKKLTQKEKLKESWLALCDFHSFVKKIQNYIEEYNLQDSELESMASFAESTVKYYKEKLA